MFSLIWGGVRGSGHTTVPLPVVEKQEAKTAPQVATNATKKKPVAKKTVTRVVKPPSASSKPQPLARNVQTAVAPASLQVILHASELSWVDGCADGRVVFSKAFSAGETGQIKFSNVATVRAGNAGGIEITFGSQPAERMGAKGLIHMWKFTPQGRQEVPPGSHGACTAH